MLETHGTPELAKELDEKIKQALGGDHPYLVLWGEKEAEKTYAMRVISSMNPPERLRVIISYLEQEFDRGDSLVQNIFEAAAFGAMAKMLREHVINGHDRPAGPAN